MRQRGGEEKGEASIYPHYNALKRGRTIAYLESKREEAFSYLRMSRAEREGEFSVVDPRSISSEKKVRSRGGGRRSVTPCRRRKKKKNAQRDLCPLKFFFLLQAARRRDETPWLFREILGGKGESLHSRSRAGRSEIGRSSKGQEERGRISVGRK